MRLVIHGNETARECAALATFFASLGEAREQDSKDLSQHSRGLRQLFAKGTEPTAAPVVAAVQADVAAAAAPAVAEAVVEAEKPKRTRTVKEKPAPVIGEGAPTPPPVVVATQLPETAAQQPAVEQTATQTAPPAAPVTLDGSAPTKQDCLSALEKLLAAKNMDACAAALAQFSDAAGEPCKAVRQINPAEYASFIARCEEMSK